MIIEETSPATTVFDGDGYATADDLVTGDLDLTGRDFILPATGRKVRVRGLSRGELFVNGKGNPDPDVLEARTISAALIKPKMSVGRVRAWQANGSAGGDLKTLSEFIRDLSGLGAGADKSAVPEVSD